MDVVESVLVNDSEEFDRWVRVRHATVTVAEEDWECVTLEARADVSGTGQQRCRYTYRLPPAMAMRRLHNTFVVGLEHPAADGGRCLHVRLVRPGLAFETWEVGKQQAVLVATARVCLERRTVCGASSANLRSYVVTKVLDWRG